MPRKKCFTEEQVIALKANPFTHSVSQYKISFTVEFKEFLYAQTKVSGMTAAKIFSAAGYDVSMFSKGQINAIRLRIIKEAESENGFTAYGRSEKEKAAAFAAQDLSKKKTDKAIRELQEQVIRLQQQIEFLKKISSVMNSSNL